MKLQAPDVTPALKVQLSEAPSETVPFPVPNPVKDRGKVAVAVPEPVKATVGGVPGALELTVTVADSADPVEGLNPTGTTQVEDGGRTTLQMPRLLDVKSVFRDGETPTITTELTVRGRVGLVFEMVKLRTGLDCPVCTVPKGMAEGLTAIDATFAGPLAEKSAATVKPGVAMVRTQGETEQVPPVRELKVLPTAAVAVRVTEAPLG